MTGTRRARLCNSASRAKRQEVERWISSLPQSRVWDVSQRSGDHRRCGLHANNASNICRLDGSLQRRGLRRARRFTRPNRRLRNWSARGRRVRRGNPRRNDQAFHTRELPASAVGCLARTSKPERTLNAANRPHADHRAAFGHDGPIGRYSEIRVRKHAPPSHARSPFLSVGRRRRHRSRTELLGCASRGGKQYKASSR